MNPIEITGRQEIAGKSFAFAQYVSSLMIAKGSKREALQLFESKQPRSRYREMIEKASVAAGSTLDGSWGAALSPVAPLADAFVEYLRPQTVIGRMSGFRSMPFNVRAPRALSGTAVGWTGQGAPMLVSGMTFDSMVFPISKIGGIVVLTKELALSSDPEAMKLFRQDLAGAVASFSDASFLNPSIAEVPDVSPASITYGAPTVASTGNTADAFAADFKALCALITTTMEAPYLIMKPTTAVALAAMNSQLTRNVGAKGGDIAGIPVITSANTPSDGDSPSDNTIILIDAAEVFMNEGSIEFDASEHTTVQMATAPDSPVTAATVLTSMWQNNLIAVLVRRYLRWQRRREGSVAVLTGVGY